MEEAKNCSDFKGYACVPYYQCSNNSRLITDGDGLIDIRRRRSVRGEDGKCPGFQDPRLRAAPHHEVPAQVRAAEPQRAGRQDPG